MALDGKKPDYTLLYLELENELSGNYNYSDFKSIVDSVKPKIDRTRGQIVVFGTGGDMGLSGKNTFKELWENKE